MQETDSGAVSHTSEETLVFKRLTGEPEIEKGKMGEKKFLCSVCKNAVEWGEPAIQCDSLTAESENSNHWTHIMCLEKTHLLNGTEIPLTPEFYERLNQLEEFRFSCKRCQLFALPLPIQLYQQGKISVEELKILGVFTPQMEDYFELIARPRSHIDDDKSNEYSRRNFGSDFGFESSTIQKIAIIQRILD